MYLCFYLYLDLSFINLSKLYLILLKFWSNSFFCWDHKFYWIIILLYCKIYIFQAYLGPCFSFSSLTAIPISWNLVNTPIHIIHTLQDFILFYYSSSQTWYFYPVKTKSDLSVLVEEVFFISKTNTNSQICVSDHFSFSILNFLLLYYVIEYGANFVHILCSSLFKKIHSHSQQKVIK